MVNVSIVVPAHNEEKTIEAVLLALLGQEFREVAAKVEEIIVVSDGSTDATDAIVQNLAKANPTVRLIRQGNRGGKVSALNVFLAQARCELVAAFDGDAVANRNCLEQLLRPLVRDPFVGGTSARKIPDSHASLPNALWEIIHRFCLIAPKLSGSAMAFRKVLSREIPPTSIDDDVFVQKDLERQGYRIAYVPEAVVTTVEPDTLGGYLRQRERVYRGHVYLSRDERVMVGSLSPGLALKALAGAIRAYPRRTPVFILSAFFEVVARLWGWLRLRRTPRTGIY